MPQPQPNVRSYAWRDYGNRVGGWRLLEFANEYELPYAVLINSELYNYCRSWSRPTPSEATRSSDMDAPTPSVGPT